MRNFIILLLVLAIGVGAWFTLRDDGLLDQVTQARVEQALLDNGAPPKLAACMAERMVDKLSINQLRKLERLRADEGESPVPLTPTQALERLERVDDPQAVRVMAEAGARCALTGLLE